MSDPQRIPDPTDAAASIAASMLQNIVELNKRVEENQKLYVAIHDKLDELCGYFEIMTTACDMLSEKIADGADKITAKHIVQAVAEAAAEIMPAEDEPGDEDPLVPSR